MFDAFRSGGPGGEAPQESREVWGAARPPNREKMVGAMVNTFCSSQGKNGLGGRQAFQHGENGGGR